MNIPALLIAVGVGAAFLAAELKWYFQPSFINPDLVISSLSPDHMRARAAVRDMLIDPGSAQFDGLRSVTADAARYVCGVVKARDRSGNLADAGFVYVVAVDFAHIDDGGRMTRKQSSFRPCPVADDAPKIAQTDFAISPGTLAMVKTAQKLVPKGNPSALSALTKLAPAAGGTSGGQSMEQQIRELAGRTAIPSDQASAPPVVAIAKAAVSDPVDWRADQPPVAWPTFPAGHPLAKPTRKRSPSEALALAKDVEDRWRRSEAAADPKLRPSSDEINEACRALLAIDPIDMDYRKAWAAFVRLQQIDRRIAAK